MLLAFERFVPPELRVLSLPSLFSNPPSSSNFRINCVLTGKTNHVPLSGLPTSWWLVSVDHGHETAWLPPYALAPPSELADPCEQRLRPVGSGPRVRQRPTDDNGHSDSSGYSDSDGYSEGDGPLTLLSCASGHARFGSILRSQRSGQRPAISGFGRIRHGGLTHASDTIRSTRFAPIWPIRPVEFVST